MGWYRLKILVLNGGKFFSIEGAVVRFKNIVVNRSKHEVVWVDSITSRDCYKTEDLDLKVPKNVKLVHGEKCNKNPVLELMAREQHFLKAVKENKCDVCVFFNSWGMLLARKYLKRKGVPVVFDYIDLMHMFRKTAFERFVARESVLDALKSSDLVITTSSKIYADAKQYNKKVLFIPNGVDLDFFSKVNPQKLRHPAVGFVGGFGDWVDFNKLSKAIEENKGVFFYFIGDGFTKKDLKKAKNVFVSDGFLPQSEARRWMAAFDVCVIPFKKNELTDAVCPLKLFEYWALKKPVIVTPTYELERIACGGEVLFAEGSEEWAAQIRQLVGDARLRKKIGGKGFVKAKEYSWNKLSANYLRALEALVA